VASWQLSPARCAHRSAGAAAATSRKLASERHRDGQATIPAPGRRPGGPGARFRPNLELRRRGNGSRGHQSLAAIIMKVLGSRELGTSAQALTCPRSRSPMRPASCWVSSPGATRALPTEIPSAPSAACLRAQASSWAAPPLRVRLGHPRHWAQPARAALKPTEAVRSTACRPCRGRRARSAARASRVPG
jgi:hypothetical protein